MTAPPTPYQRALPQIASIALLLTLMFLCLLPCVLVDVMHTAVANLHLPAPHWAGLIVLGILLGGLINIPIRRIPREDLQPVARWAVYGLEGWRPQVRLEHAETILAVNVGGCIIPTLLALYEIAYIVDGGGRPVLALAIAVAVNIAVCYRFATPVEGVGIAMPAFIAPLAAVLVPWLLLAGDDYDGIRAPVAFTAGVMGPLVGADLLNLRKITKISAGVVSIGGAGTFDGIVISSILAALLA